MFGKIFILVDISQASSAKFCAIMKNVLKIVSWTNSPRERFRIDLVVLRDGSRLNHPSELRFLNENQTLLHVFLAPLHPASSPASLLVDRPIVRPLRLRAFRRGRLQTTTLRSRRRLPDRRHRGRLMIRLVDHGSWIADLVSRIKNTRIDIRAQRRFQRLAHSRFTWSLIVNFTLPANFRKPRAIYPSAIYPLRRPSFPSDSRTRDLDPDDSIRTLALDLTAYTLRARSPLDRPCTRSEPKRAMLFHHRWRRRLYLVVQRDRHRSSHLAAARVREQEREKGKERRETEIAWLTVQRRVWNWPLPESTRARISFRALFSDSSLPSSHVREHAVNPTPVVSLYFPSILPRPPAAILLFQGRLEILLWLRNYRWTWNSASICK